MLLLLISWLGAMGWKLPAAFSYFSTRMILSTTTALLCTIFLGPRFIRKLYELKIGQTIRSVQDAPLAPLIVELHGKKKDTPTMGGILILSAMAISLFLWMDLSNVFTWILLATTIVLGYLGGHDDYLKLRHKNTKGLKARKKMIVQVGFSALVALYLLVPGLSNTVAKIGLKAPIAKEQIVEGKKIQAVTLSVSEYTRQFYLPFFKEPIWIWPAPLAFIFMIFVVIGASNAVNLTDGLDGLAAGCLVMVSLVLALFAFLSNHIDLARYLNILYIEGSGEIAVYLFAMAGAALGFLWYNGYPAQVFMGDTGSLALGGVLGVSSILLSREVILAIAGAIFVAEAMSVILQVLSYRYRNKKRIFLCAPLHHHFEYKGWPEMKVVIRFWIISLLFAIIAIASLKLQ